MGMLKGPDSLLLRHSGRPRGVHHGRHPYRSGGCQRLCDSRGLSINNNGASVITGNVGIYPGSAITGFGAPLTLTGVKDEANSAARNAKNALTTAYNEAMGQAFDTDLSGQDLGGMTLKPGVYKFAGMATSNGLLTLDADGQAAPVWTFQVGSALFFAAGSRVVFSGAGSADQVTWQVRSPA
ncbi:hypothetical protein B484DRAFT_427018 [Ochromonadaceae sp. CCMP2298]|nr:hypothetical protein B484DRAFT_427018 [Ochromonadaceae sp. CCMP2298]